MQTFWKSLQFSASLAGFLISPLLGLSVVLAHLSRTSDLARSISVAASIIALPVFALSIYGLVASRRSELFVPISSGAPMNRLAVVSMFLSLCGLLTLGIASVAGIFTGVLALKSICVRGDQRGQKLAVASICVAFGILGLLTVMLFVGP